MKRLISLAVIIILAAILIPPYAAKGQPQVCGYYGTVTLDGAPVPDGTAVKAWIDGEVAAETTTSTYGGDSVYDISIPGVYEGETVTFTIGEDDILAGTAIWVTGEFFNLDLVVGSTGPKTI